MINSGYSHSDTSSNATVFEFISSGPKGDIKKIVQFTPMGIKNVFNLAFGNLNYDGSLDDRTANDNKDRNKILITVANVVYNFTAVFPDSYVFFVGSTKGRTRLYRMAITINYDQLIKRFEIWGLTENDEMEPFEKNRAYTAFLIKRKT